MILFALHLTASGTMSGEAALQTQIEVTGRVTDASTGESLPGVSVIIRETEIGTVTNADGEYSLGNVPSNAVLQFSYVGMLSREVAVDGRTIIDVTMEVDVVGLDEVVVIGYGTVRKADVTGSVARVDVEELNTLPNVSVLQSLHSNVPGLTVGQVNRPGGNPRIDVRGYSTLSTSAGANAPLIVVDGTIYRGNLIDINSNDIETVDILKDASSTAIYGSQASNGVILITTKRGSRDVSKPIVSYSGNYSIESPSNMIEPMRADEYLEHFNQVNWTTSRLAPDYIQPNPEYDPRAFMKTAAIIDGYNKGVDTDWLGELTRDPFTMNHNLSIRGKSDDLSYFMSGGYTDATGFILNDDYNRYSMRVNSEAQINDWMNFGIESFFTSTDRSGYVPSIGSAYGLQPWAPIYDADGELILRPEGSMINPFAQMDIPDKNKNNNLFGNIYANISLPVQGLSYRVNFAQNYRQSSTAQYNQWGAGETGSGYSNHGMAYDWSTDNILSYQRIFGVHSINATLLYGVEKRQGENTNASAQGFTDGSLGYYSLQSGTSTLNSISTGGWEESSLYSMARVMYNLMDKYMVTGTVRRDGFSGFGSARKIGVFPSVALAWVASNESFLDNTDWLNYLKLRGSYGSTGRRGVSRYQTLARMSRGDSYIFGEGGSTVIGQWISSMSNNELGWETTTGMNLGVDFSVLNSRIYGNIEYYENNTSDILYNIQLPQMGGFGSIATNIGKVANNGLEFAITGDVIRASDFSWSTTVNFTRNRNEIVSILGVDNDGDGKEDDLVANRLFIGEPQRVIYGYEIIGHWQLDDDIPSGFFPGSYKIADLNEDGAYSASDDMKILGYQDPAYQMSFINRVNYKNFSFYMLVNTIQGGNDYYWGNDDPQSAGYWRQGEQLRYTNGPKGGIDWWLPENPNAYYRRPDSQGSYEALRWSQRNFIRLQDLSLSYTFDKGLISRVQMESLRIHVSAKNLITITDWKGTDPEAGMGFAPGHFPIMKSFSFGVNVEF